VDDAAEPVKELERLWGVHHLFFGKPRREDQMPITETVARELQAMLVRKGFFQGEANGVWDDASKRAFWVLVGNENLEERWNIEGKTDHIDSVALEYLRERFGK
jgi:uncharacterized Ntn-hydrolase superfamily protein